MTAFTTAEKRREIERELRQRENVYPRLIANGKLTQQKADRQMAVLRAVLDDYAESDLFGEKAR